jgi:hypothetical protein
MDGRVDRILPLAPHDPGTSVRFPIWCRLDRPSRTLRLGETGAVRIEVGRWNVYQRMARAWARLVRADFWL